MDANFPDGSIVAARNYCRNPDRDSRGPWCHTGDSNTAEYCSVPLCKFVLVSVNTSAYIGLTVVTCNRNYCNSIRRILKIVSNIMYAVFQKSVVNNFLQ